jgi:ATP-dependent DNA helicase PIF1
MSKLPPKFSIKNLRKKHPKLGMRWTLEEDETLKSDYQIFQKDKLDFKECLVTWVEKYGRAEGGIIARLAKYFPDVPGFDYELAKEREKTRAEQKSQKVETEEKEEPEEEKVKETFAYNFTENTEANEALKILNETNKNIFLTGEAGTGKSTLLKYFRHTTQKNMAVLAPTGVAALNVEGQTIHSFCGFGPSITLSTVKKLAPFSPKFKLLQKIQVIVIDEISMVRADLLDCVDKFLKLNGPAPKEPFGGIQMVFIGDLHQLPPVEKDFVVSGSLFQEYKSPYFFDSYSYRKGNFAFVELKTMYRQKDEVFVGILNAVRNNVVLSEHLKILNTRAKSQEEKFSFEQFAVYLTTTNVRASQINNFFLEKIPTEAKVYQGRAQGKFENRELPTDLSLQVKVGAQVMMLNNDQRKRWVNGTMGKVIKIEGGESSSPAESFEDSSESHEGFTYEEIADEFLNPKFSSPLTAEITVELETGEVVSVSPYTWEMFEFTLDRKKQKVDSKTVGSYTQYPFKLAWAVTIHKAQGKTFDKVYIDLSTGTFAHGQLYVALSRCRTLEGIYLKRPIVPKDIILDKRIVEFLHELKGGEIYYSEVEDFA